MSIRNLENLLDPGSVVVIGASDRPASVGATVWRNLRAGGFRGPVHAVNLRLATLDGEPVYRSVADLPDAPDLAVLCTPPATVPGLVAELGARGTRAAIVMTAGLTREQKQAMLDAARASLLRVLGPNCLGLLAPSAGLNASFAHTGALAGDIAFVSQSGALVTAVLDWAKTRRIGFSRLVSLGERSDVDFGDLLDWLASDRLTRSILLYIESIEQSRKFMSAARAAARNKPVIVVKAGRAGQGVKAASSHTGALAGSDIVFDAAIRRAGMLRVDTLGELFTAAETLARFAAGTRADELVVVTNGGGGGVMAADAAALAGIPMAPLTEALQASLDSVLPPTWSRGNPIDIIGDAPVDRYTATLRAVFAEPTWSAKAAVLFLHAPTAIVRADDIARACLPIAREQRSRLMACWLGDAAVAPARAMFAEAGIADYATPEEAVRAFGMLRTYRRNQALLMEIPARTPAPSVDRAAARRVVEAALERGGGMLDEADAKTVLAAYGVPTVPTRPVGLPIAEAVTAAREIGYPVALKIRSPDITHKTDVGGVALGLADEAALRDAHARMLLLARAARPDAKLDGFTVQQMAMRRRAEELIVGASIDPAFGPVILFGAGGTAVEVDNDHAIALPPLNAPLARELISRTRVARRLAGYRDVPPADLAALEGALVAVSELLADTPELAELDINPLWASAAGVLALDARIRIDAKAGAGADRFAIRPYPDQLEERVRWEGRTLLLRPIRPDDGEAHRAFVERLDPEDLRLRFFQIRRELPKSELARLTQIDYAREMAFIAVDVERPGETLGVARAVADPDNIEAEYAIVVRSDLKGRGLGRVLMDKLIRYCRANGTQRLVGVVLRENRLMLELDKELGFRIDAEGSDRDALRVVLALG